MGSIRRAGLSSFLSGFILLGCIPAQAQGVTFSPEVITVEGRRDHIYIPAWDWLPLQFQNLSLPGLKGKSITRSILLDADTDLQNLRFISLDLESNDGLQVFPVSLIQVDDPQISADDPDLAQVNITFNLAKAPEAGDFSGKILFRYNGGEQSLPLTIRVRDPWLFPLAILVLGIVLGTSLSWYQTKGRLRDELSVRENRLRRQIEQPHLKEQFQPFYEEIKRKLLLLNQALQIDNGEKANGYITEAEQLWLHWQTYETDWLNQARYYRELKDLLDSEETEQTNNFFISKINKYLDFVFDSAPLKSAEKTGKGLQYCGEIIRRYKTLDLELKKIQQNLSELQENSKFKEWDQTLKDLYQELKAIDPFPSGGKLNTVLTEFQKKIEDLRKNISPQQTGISARSVSQPRTELKMPQAPAMRIQLKGISSQNILDGGQTKVEKLRHWMAETIAWLRLNIIFPYAISLAFIAVLASSGFQELYLQNATFGSRPFADYFGLLAWGFGAEASRKSVGQVLSAKKDSHEPSLPPEEMNS